MKDKKAKFEHLHDLYYNENSSVAYSTLPKLYKYVKKEGKFFFTRLEISEWLKSQDVVTLHKKADTNMTWM